MVLHFRQLLIALGLFSLAGCSANPSTDTEDDLTPPSLDAGDEAILEDAKRPDIEDARPEAEVIDEAPDQDEDEEDDEDFRIPDCTGVSIPPEPPSIECDLFAEPQSSGCGPYEGCRPYVIKAPVECQQQSYGTKCFHVGSGGKQGSSCEYLQDCNQGFVCRLTGAGRQCTKLCQLDGIGGCDDGLVCMPIDDIPAFGGCA